VLQWFWLRLNLGHRYELALTKGKIDAGESPLEAANRELIEEIGYGAKKLSFVKTTHLAIF
jgi:ADP-ribose diphosphatase